MKRSFKAKYHILIIILFAMVVLQSILMLYALDSASSLKELKADMQSIIIIFMFVIFIYMIVIYNYIPYRLSKALQEIRNLIAEISDGNYDIKIEENIYDEDETIQALVNSITKMLTIVSRFDLLKADKIFEHNQRIQQLLSLVPNMTIILSANADTIYLNERFRQYFDNISENINLNELIIRDEYRARILQSMTNAVREGNNVYKKLVSNASGTSQMQIDGKIVRNRKGDPAGAVFILTIIKDEPKAKDTL